MPMPSPSGTQSRLPSTSWTLLTVAAGEYGEDSLAARQEFLSRYLRPVDAYIRGILRRRGADDSQADHLSIAFFEEKIFDPTLLRAADPARGRFRDLLKQALRFYVSTSLRKIDPIADGTRPDESVWDKIPDPVEPIEDVVGREFDSAWVRALLARTLDRVAETCARKQQQVHYDLFIARYLSGSEKPPSWNDLARRYEVTGESPGKAARELAETAKRHFRETIWELLIDELGSEVLAAQELEALKAFV